MRVVNIASGKVYEATESTERKPGPRTVWLILSPGREAVAFDRWSGREKSNRVAIVPVDEEPAACAARHRAALGYGRDVELTKGPIERGERVDPRQMALPYGEDDGADG